MLFRSVDFGGETGGTLRLAQLADDLGPRALGALLLRDGIVGARQLRRGAIAAGVDAVAFNLAAMAGVAPGGAESAKAGKGPTTGWLRVGGAWGRRTHALFTAADMVLSTAR